MSSKDKNGLIILATTVGLIILCVFFYFSTLAIPAWILAAGSLILQCFVCVPAVSEKYYKVYKSRIGMSRYVPLWNEISLMSSGVAVTVVIEVVVLVLTFIASRIPISVVGSVLGVQAGIQWGYNCVVIMIVLLIALDLTIGFGLSGVLKNVNRMLATELSIRFTVIEGVYYLLAFIPCVRVCFFVAVNDKLKSLLVALQKGSVKQEFVLEEGKNE